MALVFGNCIGHPNWLLPDHGVEIVVTGKHANGSFGNMDGDGDMDAATCAYVSRVAAWFENDGKGNFITHVVSDDQAAYDIRAVDMDGDEDLDLLIAGQLSQTVVWYENPLK